MEICPWGASLCHPGECQTQSVKAPHPLRLGEGLRQSKMDRLTLPAVLRCPTVLHLRSLWPTSGPSRFCGAWASWGCWITQNLGLLEHTRHPRRRGCLG